MKTNEIEVHRILEIKVHTIKIAVGNNCEGQTSHASLCIINIMLLQGDILIQKFHNQDTRGIHYLFIISLRVMRYLPCIHANKSS